MSQPSPSNWDCSHPFPLPARFPFLRISCPSPFLYNPFLCFQGSHGNAPLLRKCSLSSLPPGGWAPRPRCSCLRFIPSVSFLSSHRRSPKPLGRSASWFALCPQSLALAWYVVGFGGYTCEATILGQGGIDVRDSRSPGRERPGPMPSPRPALVDRTRRAPRARAGEAVSGRRPWQHTGPPVGNGPNVVGVYFSLTQV